MTDSASQKAKEREENYCESPAISGLLWPSQGSTHTANPGDNTASDLSWALGSGVG